jgi:hypothetical protein
MHALPTCYIATSTSSLCFQFTTVKVDALFHKFEEKRENAKINNLLETCLPNKHLPATLTRSCTRVLPPPLGRCHIGPRARGD